MNIESVDAAVVYDVRLKDPGGHFIEVTCRINDPDPEGQAISLPNWIPGSYMIRDYARHVISLEAEANGELVDVRKQNKNNWRVEPVNSSLLLRANIYANDISVRGTYFDFEHAFLNGVCLFLRVCGHESQRCVVHINPSNEGSLKEWKVATSMRRLTGTATEFGAFEASGYDELIDQPMLVGDLAMFQFDVAGVSHTFSIAGRHSADLERVRSDAQKVCQTHADFFGGKLPMSGYSFLLTVLDGGYGGLEHGSSSALICGRGDLPREGVPEVSAGYRKFLGLVSHEYFHLWNIKRIKPAEFVGSDLEQEAYTRQLWVFEGVTSYYDDRALLKSELITADSYLELLGRTLTSVYRSRGRRTQTLEESSFDAWVKFYKQDENSPNAIVSYYTKGAMVALSLDLEIRLRTAGRCSLDDVMVALWREYGSDQSSGLPEGGFERLAEEVSGVSLSDFFRQSLRNTVDPPVGILLAQFGIRLHLRAMESESDRGGGPGKREDSPRSWMGLRTRRDAGGRIFVSHVLSDGPGRRAGICAGDELVAVDGLQIAASNQERINDELRAEQPARVHVFRRGELKELELIPVRPPRDTCYLTLEPAADAATLERRRQWLGV
jgi:predicted metalloprotease with PDZ domain